MDFIKEIHQCTGIPVKHMKQFSSDEAICLLHVTWKEKISCGLKIPPELLVHALTVEKLIYCFSTFDVEDHYTWKFINVNFIQKNKNEDFRILKSNERSLLTSLPFSYSQLIHYVTKTNYKNLWEQAWKKYQSADCMKKSKYKQNCCNLLHEVLKKFYKCLTEEKEDGVLSYINPSSNIDKQIEDTNHSNFLQTLCVFETSKYVLIIYEHINCSLRDCAMFSPFMLSGSTVQPLFVVYQLVQALHSVHSNGLFLGPVMLSDIKIKENLWIKVAPKMLNSLHSEKKDFSLEEKPEVVSNCQNEASSVCHKNDDSEVSTLTEHAELPQLMDNVYLKLPSLVQRWVKGSISNYDYLMALNKIAGRHLNNPKCHYIMPWIMDFSVPDGGWRDLTKSKFRLNKGDKQLDLIYESATEASSTSINNSTNVLQDSAVTVPHHTSDVLADITYYVYKARRMPKSFLCQHVRQKWVPAEYPATIERLQEWTPDECIPEFYSDPMIFYSIHQDLNDLGIPWWCDSPEDFISKHRNALENYHVSERLHHWIDLVFGYKLTGTAAIKSKNVCLPLVDRHTSIRNYGMIQLFTHPHPHKLSKSLFLRSVAPKTFRNLVVKMSDTKDSGDDETSSDSLGKSGFFKGFRSKSLAGTSEVSRPEPRPESQTIVLPKDFNPLSALSQLEILNTFQKWLNGGNYDLNNMEENHQINEISTHHFQVRDMLILGCLISEIALYPHCKTLCKTVSLEERYDDLLKLLQLHKQDIPRSLQEVIKHLLQTTSSFHSKNDKKALFPISYPPVSESGLPIPSPHQLLLTQIHIIPFPPYFPELYKFLLHLNKLSEDINLLSEKSFDCLEAKKQIEEIAEKKVSYAAGQLQKVLPSLNPEGINLIIPYIQEMFSCPYTSLLSTWHLFGLLAQYLGPQQTCRKFLKLLVKVFDCDETSPKYLKLYHRTFLLQIIVGLGLHNFLLHFTTILIEAIGGCRDYSHLKGTDASSKLESEDVKILSSNSRSDSCNVLFDSSYEGKVMSDESLCLQSEITNEEDSEIFDIDVSEEVNVVKEDSNTILKRNMHDNISILEDSNTVSATVFASEKKRYKIHNVSQESTSCQRSIYSQSAPNLSFHSQYMMSNANHRLLCDNSEKEKYNLISNYMNCNSSCNLNVSDVSAESMLWLAHRLGPVLTARHLTRNLLRMLTLCYDSAEKREIIYLNSECKEVKMLTISGKWLRGDLNAFKVLDCLSRIASLYGEQFIMLQYIKHIADLLNLCRKHIPASLESGLLGAMTLLQNIIPYISDNTLMDNLQEHFIKDIVLLVLRLVSSLRLIYPGGTKSRTMVTFRILDVIYTIGLRIGTEMTKKHMSGVFQKIFACFDKVFNERGEYKEPKDILSSSLSSSNPIKEQALIEMRETFSSEMAFLIYIPFCKLVGRNYMEKTLKNDELIRHLCLQYDKSRNLYSKHDYPSESSPTSRSSNTSHRREHSLGQDDSFVSGVFGKNVNVVGNRLDVRLGNDSNLILGAVEPAPSLTTDALNAAVDVPKFEINLIKRNMDNTQRHLKGNWLAYWEHETGRSEKDQHFDFKQIKLQTFIGHSGTIRSIEVLDNENSFLTSSKDKTVKLWSLRSCGDGSTQTPCQWTYTQHRKSVFAVSFLNSLRLVGSCDSTVHIWDPFLGSCIKQLEPTKGSPVTVLAAMPAPSVTFLAATTNSTVRFLDARTCRYMHEFKVNIGTTGLIRSLSVSPNGNWLAVGHSTGMLSVLDIRTGLVFGTWLGHEGEVLQLKAFNNTSFITSSLDQSLTVWKFEDVQAKCSLKGSMEPVTSICFYGNEVISGTSGNRIGLHSSTDKTAMYSSTRLRSDTFKGVLTTMALLPLNRLLLLGTDNGNVILLC